MTLFEQAPPALGNQYDDDRVLRSYLSRVLPPDVLSDVEESLTEMGRLAGGELYELQLADRLTNRLSRSGTRGEIASTRSK